MRYIAQNNTNATVPTVGRVLFLSQLRLGSAPPIVRMEAEVVFGRPGSARVRTLGSGSGYQPIQEWVVKPGFITAASARMLLPFLRKEWAFWHGHGCLEEEILLTVVLDLEDILKSN